MLSWIMCCLFLLENLFMSCVGMLSGQVCLRVLCVTSADSDYLRIFGSK